MNLVRFLKEGEMFEMRKGSYVIHKQTQSYRSIRKSTSTRKACLSFERERKEKEEFILIKGGSFYNDTQ